MAREAKTGCVLCRRPGHRGRYVRIEGPVAGADGRRLGLFGLLRDLRLSGRLAAEDAERAAAFVVRAYEQHDEPPSGAFVGGGASWFREHETDQAACTGLGGLCEEVVEFLADHDVATTVVRSADPGRLTFADAVQVVAVATTPSPAADRGVGADPD